jgi:AcrR family transcriptional regulator
VAHPTRRPRRHASPETRRAEILDAALQCFADRGFHETTMDDLVRASGLSKGSLYWHFSSKVEVFLGVHDLVVERIVQGIDEIEQRTESVPETLRAQCAFLVDTLGGERTLLLAWSEFLNHPEARQRMAEIYRWSRQRLAEEIERGVERGEIRPDVAAGLPSTLTALVEGMLIQAMMDAEFAPGAALASSWDVLLSGMLP